ncbi:hypothetical protein A0H81_14348 [Grifola frondosa]|uniref:Uncharacterized protein n=1 Tax=Grifola frondosa TaxID=5627 RepID=A0A1C7LMF8_GRIFR|nr:hypothetical protein A0H81_14348 [Grifola frondosa]
MDCLELNIRQLILSDLASNIEAFKDETENAEVLTTIDLVTSKVETRAVSDQTVSEELEEERVFMPNSRVQCNIGFAELAVNLPDAHVSDSLPVLVDILRDVPYIEFDQCLAWEEWALPDQLVFATVSALLRMASCHPGYRSDAINAILKFTSHIVHKLQSAEPIDVLTQYAPSFHGFYRAIISIPFDWYTQEWAALSTHLNVLFSSDVIAFTSSRLLFLVISLAVDL